MEGRGSSEPTGAADPQGSSAHSPQTAGAPATAEGVVPLVLVVEDDLHSRRFIASVLEKRFRVATALDGVEGLAAALLLVPDLVVSDLAMPRMGGEELVREIRQHGELDGVQIMLLTGWSDEELRVRMLREGALDYLTKPFCAEELLTRAANLIALKRARERLQRELDTRDRDLDALTDELVSRQRQIQVALDVARLERDKAVRALSARDEFLALASHELRTPLTALRLSLQCLQVAGTGNVELTGHADLALRQCDRLNRLFADLLDVSRLEAAELRLDVADLELGALVREVVERFEPELEHSRCSLSLRCDVPVVGRWDRSRIDQVISNLLSNAVKFGAGRPIEISVGEHAGVASLTVRDEGIGVEPSQRARIFERYERAVSTVRYGGLGLGLYVCRRIVEAHEGKIRVESGPGSGATFVVELPCTGPRAHSPPRPGER